jgi:pimeloyl-ACP methyl ester carboxylesterase
MTKQVVGGTIAFCAVFAVAFNMATDVLAQSELPTRAVSVNNRAMWVWSEGLEGRKADQPVVILEAGAPATLDSWRPVFAAISGLAPVLAYDRSGLGRSDYDGERPTVTHVAQTLHVLLDAAHIPPPYVLVGAS